MTICPIAGGAWLRVGTPSREIKSLLLCWGTMLQQATIGLLAKNHKQDRYIAKSFIGPDTSSSCASSSCSTP